MKIVYQSDDGSTFDTEADCLKHEAEANEKDALYNLLIKGFQTNLACQVSDFIFERKDEIINILTRNPKTEFVYKDVTYIPIREIGGCAGCAFRNTTEGCELSVDVIKCSEKQIIWVGKP